MAARVTIRDVASAAGVSVATVSRVLNGHPGVGPGLAKRVQKAAQSLGYVPDPAGRALRRQVADMWNVIVPDFHAFFTAVIDTVEGVAMEQGIAVLVSNTRASLEYERRYIAAASAHRAAGAIVAVVSEHESDVSPLLEGGAPVVLLDRRVDSFKGDTVLLDNHLAGRLVAEHLLGQGFRNMACITGPAAVSATEERLQGFADALATAGRPLDPAHIVHADLEPAAGRQAMRSLLAGPNPPEAVYADAVSLTLGSFQALAERPVGSPPVALAGQDDDLWTELVRPAVTVVRQPVADLGKVAASQLLARMAGDDAPASLKVLPPELVVRESSLRV
ncbi:MAG: LacI family transcriptional regulator [Bifidobacteriaceae bacterium]|nr:LacI family transcriptional regulator [Bifidobacteriaceae bacterium]